MIFTSCILLVYVAYTKHELIRNIIVSILVVLLLANLISLSKPNAASLRYETFRRLLFFISFSLEFAFFLIWLAWIASEDEAKDYGWRTSCAFITLALGAFFYMSKFPERSFQDSRWIAYCMSSHTIFHILAFATVYQLTWIQYDYNLHVEKTFY